MGKNGTEYVDSDEFYPFEGMNEWSDAILEFWTISDYGLTRIPKRLAVTRRVRLRGAELAGKRGDCGFVRDDHGVAGRDDQKRDSHGLEHRVRYALRPTAAVTADRCDGGVQDDELSVGEEREWHVGIIPRMSIKFGIL